ncbi:hypothetical protein FEM08_24630 [Flavobacterium gilvum]|nr:hypothetical protein FEM08_24630 [Flavobacterium gilvum]
MNCTLQKIIINRNLISLYVNTIKLCFLYDFWLILFAK